jgi:hypothetical protein
MPCSALKALCLPNDFTLVSCTTYSSILKIKATCSSETSVDFQQSTRCYIPEDITLHNHRCENLKSLLTWSPVYFAQLLPLRAMVLSMLVTRRERERERKRESFCTNHGSLQRSGNPEVDNCKVCRNVTKPSTFDADSSRKPKLQINLHKPLHLFVSCMYIFCSFFLVDKTKEFVQPGAVCPPLNVLVAIFGMHLGPLDLRVILRLRILSQLSL